MISDLFKILSELKNIASVTNESWNSLNFSGFFQDDLHKDIFRRLENIITNNKFKKVINYQIDDEPIDNIESFCDSLFQNTNWKININKALNIEETNLNFFNDINEFKKWSDSLNPFHKENPIAKFVDLQIIVRDLKEKIIGYNYIISNDFQNEVVVKPKINLPSFDKIQQHVYILSKANFEINPLPFLIINARYNEYSMSFFRMSLQTLACTLTTEIIDIENVILRGVRKINLELFENDHVHFNTQFVDELSKTVEWVYEEKTELRLKLFLERITLDINYNNKYINELILLNRISLEQAKERYSFALFERKDQHQKELRELLKDLKIISDLYSTKVRTVLANLLRDVLAGFFLIAITMFSKIDNLKELLTNASINYVFKGFSLYFLISIVYQLSMDWFDITKTENEFNYWKNTSREYLSEIEFNKHKNETLGKRKKGTVLFYISLATIYFIIAYFTWNFANYFK